MDRNKTISILKARRIQYLFKCMEDLRELYIKTLDNDRLKPFDLVPTLLTIFEFFKFNIPDYDPLIALRDSMIMSDVRTYEDMEKFDERAYEIAVIEDEVYAKKVLIDAIESLLMTVETEIDELHEHFLWDGDKNHEVDLNGPDGPGVYYVGESGEVYEIVFAL